MTYLLDSAIKKPKVLVTEHSSSQVSSSLANTSVVISGTEISYDPDATASKVIYEVSFYAQRINYITFQCFTLQHYTSGAWSEINQRYLKNVGNSGSSTQTARYYIHFRYVLPAWTGSRDLRIITASNGAGKQISMHQVTSWEGATVADKFCNTNVLIYSI